MNMKKILLCLISFIAALSLSFTPAFAETYTYDLKTYEIQDGNSTVLYTIEYAPQLNTNAYIVKNPEDAFIIDFINTNVVDIKTVTIETQQLMNIEQPHAFPNVRKYTYTKDADIAREKGYIYYPNYFCGTYINIPYDTTNGFELGQTLKSLGFDSIYSYGFSYVKISLVCDINKKYADEQAYGTIGTINFIDENGNDREPNFSNFSYSVDIINKYKVYPFKTSLYSYSYKTDGGNVLYTNNIVSALNSPKMDKPLSTLYNPVAEINDIIAKSDDVAFTFVSYNNPETSNAATYSAVNYLNMDLFTGSLIVNGNYTLSLHDTDAFSWKENKLTFYWSEITNNSMSPFKNYFTSMTLYTTVDWYWDSLIIETIELNEDVSAGCGCTEGGLLIS